MSLVVVDVFCVVLVVVTVARELEGVGETGRIDVDIMFICFDIMLLLLLYSSFLVVVDIVYS